MLPASLVLAVTALTLALILGVLGCATISQPFGHLAGTHDVRLEYAVGPAASGARSPSAEVVAPGVKARLSSAAIPADVDASPEGRVVVIVDGDMAGAVDDLVTWTGGLRVLLVDDDVTVAPADSSGARPWVADGPRGDRGWRGTAEAIGRIARETKLDAGHALFAERIPGETEWRTRVGVLPPLVVLGVGDAPFRAVEPADSGRRLAITIGSEARSILEAARASHPGARVILARGRALVATTPIDDVVASPIVIPLGDDLPAYTRAYRLRLLLESPGLPPLQRVGVAALPARFGIAVACAALPFLLSVAWLFFVRRFDRARPEPVWLVGATFLLGGLAIVPAAAAELGLGELSPWLDPGLATLGGQPRALPLAIAVFTVVVGAVEESAKYLAAWVLPFRRKEFDEPVDGIVYGCAAALGFAAVENVKYFALGRMSGTVIALRAFETVPAHMFFGAIWGYAAGQKLVSRRARVLPFLAVAALVHGTFDAIVSTDGMQLVATLLVLALAVTFVVLLRRSLRHGATPPRARFEEPPVGELPVSQLARSYFRVGSRRAFYGSAAAMIFCAFALTVLGTAFELLRHRVGVVFVSLATLMLGLFGLAAWATSATIPLDVALDARGVTFAGGLTAWSAIRRRSVARRGRRAYVVLSTTSGDQRLGPTSPTTAEAMLAAMQSFEHSA